MELRYDDRVQELVEAVVLRAVMDYYEDPKKFPDALEFVKSCPFGISRDTAATIERGMLRGVKPHLRYREDKARPSTDHRPPVQDAYLQGASRLRRFLRENHIGQRTFAQMARTSQGRISNMCTARLALTPEVTAFLDGGVPPP